MQVSYEAEVYKKNQSVCWLEINETPVLNDAKQVIAIEGIARDITGNKQYESTLKHALVRTKHQDTLQTALDAANAGTFSYDIINDKTWWDEKSYELFSVNPKKYKNNYKSWKKLVLADDIDKTETELNRALESRDTHFELNYRIKVGKNEIRWINVKAQITRNKQHQALWLDGLHLNITSAKELEIKQLESEIRFRTLVENSPDWIWETDTKGHFIYASPYIKELLGYEPKEILGQTIFSLMLGDERIRLLPIFQEYFKQQCSFSGVESTNLHKDGTLVFLETNASPMFDIDGNFTGYRGIHRNKTEQVLSRQLKIDKEIAERANIAKSEFLANMSHELRTPMHAILSFSNFGIKKVNSVSAEKLLSYFEKIHLSGERLLSLLNDLLDLSKIEAGKLTFDFAPHDLNSILKKAVSEQESVLKNKRLTVNHLEPECNTEAQLDSVKVTQVIANFLSNAIKFSKQGATISIKITQDELFSGLGNAPALRLSVTDQGIGIPQGELECIFDEFIQSSKTKASAGGTGLGLSICKEFIDAHHGRIWAEHNVGDGAVFNFVIPLHQDNYT
jgi:PAS domain S-box-containing protein